MSTKSSKWFEVDREGLREIHGSFPPERLVMELVQNAWDEPSPVCELVIDPETALDGRRTTTVNICDSSPHGFKNLADAYTLFRSTSKRNDPEKRGRFNLGDKLILARAIAARITSTTGEIRFDRTGRHVGRRRRVSGSEIEVHFPRWTKTEYEQAIAFLHRLLPPATISFTINGVKVQPRTPEIVHSAVLQTEILRSGLDGVTAMTRSARSTQIEFYPKAGASPYLYEMGIPVCEIAGDRDINVLQKVPLSQDRTTVPAAFLQDIYAETVIALGGNLNAEQFGIEIVQSALSDDRVDPTTAKNVFKRLYGETAAIQSHDPDSDQEAVRKGFTLVPSRTWGKAVNDKLRVAGVPTTHSLFGRSPGGECSSTISPRDYTSEQSSFVGYVAMLARELCDDREFTVALGRWDGSSAIAFNHNRNHVEFHVDRVDISHPVTKSTAVIIHELGHCRGTGHDGVYDFEFERLVNALTTLLARRPELFRPFEPTCFASGSP